MYNDKRVACVIPAFDEEQAISQVVEGLLSVTTLSGDPVIDELIVCDNNSQDKTASVAKAAGAKVVFEAQQGYGKACLTGIAAVKDCDFLLFVDGDHSCLPEQSLLLLEQLMAGADLSIGSRVLGHIESGALTIPQRFGNWLSAIIIRCLWQQNVTDLGPFRAIRWQALQGLNMADEAFGWTVEMQVKAIQQGLRVEECAVDSILRVGQSKISGTIKGSVLAGVGILSMIFTLWCRELLLSKKSRI